MMVLITLLPRTGFSKPQFHKMWGLKEFGLSLVQENLLNLFIPLHSFEYGNLLLITTLGGFVSPSLESFWE